MINRRKYLLPSIGAVLIAVLLIIAAGVALAGCELLGAGDGITTDDTTGVEFGPSVPDTAARIPSASIKDDYASPPPRADDDWPGEWGFFSEANQRYHRWKFFLYWGPREDWIVDEAGLIRGLENALAKWNEFEVLMDPRPHIDPKQLPPGADKFNVAVNKQFKENVIFMRYWIPEDLGPNGKLTVAKWQDATKLLARKTAYDNAKAYFENMLLEIKQSPYYDYVITEANGSTRPSPIKIMYGRIEAFIKEGSGVTYSNLADFWWYEPRDFGITSDVPSTSSVSIDYRKSSPLYEIYFGFIPEANSTNYFSPANAQYK
jgi:hypothetical protein